jgi:hypothetical protein
MKTSIRGKNTRLSKRQVRDVMGVFASFLLSKRLAKNIYVEVFFSDLSKNDWGYCCPTDFDYPNHREFEIIINSNLSKINQLKTLAHEMMHLRQYAVGDLKQYKDEKYRWLGKKVQMTEADYDKMPWEVQAYLAEEPMVSLYKKYCRRKNIRI